MTFDPPGNDKLTCRNSGHCQHHDHQCKMFRPLHHCSSCPLKRGLKRVFTTQVLKSQWSNQRTARCKLSPRRPRNADQGKWLHLDCFVEFGIPSEFWARKTTVISLGWVKNNWLTCPHKWKHRPVREKPGLALLPFTCLQLWQNCGGFHLGFPFPLPRCKAMFGTFFSLRAKTFFFSNRNGILWSCVF